VLAHANAAGNPLIPIFSPAHFHIQQKAISMSDSNMLTTLTQERSMLCTNDGWAAAAAEAGERNILGTLLKFSDSRWTAGKEQTQVETGTKLVAIATVAMWVRWEDRKPVEYRIREKDGRLPEREELGHTEKARWELGTDGEPKDPWQNTRLVYLVNPDTGEAFTYSTSSVGGRSAVSDLANQITRMRNTHPDVSPIVELRAAEMKTKHGKKSKPVFKVVDWRKPGEPSGLDRAADHVGASP
jgi:hypothetical protein